MNSYPGPVYVHTVQHALATCPAGMKPLPVKTGESAMRPVPVRVVVHDNGTAFTLGPSSFVVVQHVAAKPDDERGPAEVEQPAALVFHVRIPAGYMLVKAGEYTRNPEAAEPADDAAPPDPTTQEGPREIPEFANVDPAVFAFNPEAVNRGLREVFNKGKSNEGAEG